MSPANLGPGLGVLIATLLMISLITALVRRSSPVSRSTNWFRRLGATFRLFLRRVPSRKVDLPRVEASQSLPETRNATGRSRTPIFTIGHSNQNFDSFLALLQRYEVDVVIDTRSVPRSRVAPQFDKDCLGGALHAVNILYAHKGRALGGRPKSKEFYDPDGHVRYDLIAKTRAFRGAVASIERGNRSGHRIALLCAEEDPLHCHRRLL